MPVPKEVKMAFRKWSWICVVVGIFGMNVFTRYSFAEEKYAEKNRVPAISNEYQGITPEFAAWLQKFRTELEKSMSSGVAASYPVK